MVGCGAVGAAVNGGNERGGRGKGRGVGALKMGHFMTITTSMGTNALVPHPAPPSARALSLSLSALFFLFKSSFLPLLSFQSLKYLPFPSHQTTNRPAGCRKTSPGGISNHIGHDSNEAFRLSKWHYVWCPSHVCWCVRGRFLSGRCYCEAATFRSRGARR